MKALKTALTLVVFLFTNLIFAQLIGEPFPEMETETVEDEIITLPNDTMDKFTLVGLAYSKKSEDEFGNTIVKPEDIVESTILKLYTLLVFLAEVIVTS